MRPPNVTANVDRPSEEGGWQGWGHWLGACNARGNVGQWAAK